MHRKVNRQDFDEEMQAKADIADVEKIIEAVEKKMDVDSLD